MRVYRAKPGYGSKVHWPSNPLDPDPDAGRYAPRVNTACGRQAQRGLHAEPENIPPARRCKGVGCRGQWEAWTRTGRPVGAVDAPLNPGGMAVPERGELRHPDGARPPGDGGNVFARPYEAVPGGAGRTTADGGHGTGVRVGDNKVRDVANTLNWATIGTTTVILDAMDHEPHQRVAGATTVYNYGPPGCACGNSKDEHWEHQTEECTWLSRPMQRTR